MSIDKSKKIFEDSKEGTIGARIKVLLLDYDNNVSALEDAGGIGNGTLKTWKDKPLDFSTTIVSNFRNKLRIDPVWWDTGKGDIYLSNGTQGQKKDDYKQNGHDPRETFYADLIENNEQYTLIPRAVLSDYKIVPDKMLDTILGEMKAAMNMAKESLTEKYELIIKVKENRIKELEQKLRSKFPGKD